MRVGYRAPGVDRQPDRRGQQLGERRRFGPGIAGASAEDDQGPAGGAEQFGGAGDVVRRRRRPGSRGADRIAANA